ncbi:MAG: hypothetical protein L0Z62_42780 [Gemmataceae bacterium]|nr:hypothetical protein [Gemmataceae bacterium]
MSFVEKFKSVAGSAAETVAGAAGAAAGAVSGAASSAAGTVAGATGTLLNAGIDKLKEWVDEVSAASPLLKDVGFEVGDIQLELSLKPRVLVRLIRQADAPDEAFQAVLANHSGNKTLGILVRMIQQARRMEKRIPIKGRRFQSLEVEMGLPPAARMCYVECPEEPPAES